MVNVGNKIPLSRQVAQHLKQKMQQGIYQSGSMLPSVRKLRDDFGVSTNVIYRAMRELEENGLVQSHHGKGTMVQENNRVARTAILFAFIQPYPASTPFEQRVIQYAEEGFSARGNLMVFRSSQLDVALEREIAEHAINNGVQGILLWPVENNPNGPFFEKLSQKVPIVLVDRLLDNAKLPAVIFDTYEAGKDICREMLEVKNRKRMLCIIDDLKISPYKNLMQGLRDQAKIIGRSDDLTIIQLELSKFIEQINNNDFSAVNHFKEDVEKLITKGGYDTIFSPQDQFLKHVIVETGLHDQLNDIQLVDIFTPNASPQARQYNKSGVLHWILDFPQLIEKANDMLQRIVLTGNANNEIVNIKVRQSQL
ncbi:MAG: GntR family transcriptional regulator [Phycisphaeraceae bacterium]|nr:GntR family transcriptional regulator [Phycisphaeraceae bacterium]